MDKLIFDRITSENKIMRKGLSQNTVYSILQDQYGYMWFGTWDGLNKYDGYEFTIYNKNNGLSNETIHVLFEDENGNLWIGTENGLNCYERNNGEFKIFKYNSSDSTSISDSWINSIYQDSSGRILICTPRGLNVHEFDTDIFKRYQTTDSWLRANRSNWVNRIIYDTKGLYWVATNFGLVKYTKTGETIRYLNRPDDPGSLSSNNVNTVFRDKSGRIWAGSDNGLDLLLEKSGTFKHFENIPGDTESLSNNLVTVIYEDSFGIFWIGTDGGGLNIFDPESEKFKRLYNIPNNPNSLSNNRIYSIYEDRSGNIWVGTFKGVNKFNRHFSRFTLYTHDPKNTNTVGDNFIWAFEEAEPNVFWIGTDDGISIFDKNDGTYRHIKPDPNNPNSLSDSRIRCILKDKHGNFWIGTKDSGLDKYDPKTGKFSNFRYSIHEKNCICDNYILSLYEDRNGIVWVGTGDGINTIDPVTNIIGVYKYIRGDSACITYNSVYDICEDSYGILWFATKEGLCRYNRETDNCTTYRNIFQRENNITTNKLFCIYEDSDKNLWIGSKGGGLAKFDRKTRTFKSYTIDDSLPNNVIYGILEDDDGNLWMSTNWGLSKFNKEIETFINYDVTDGLQSNEFNAGAYLKSSAGEMLFGGMKGFNSFFPSEIKLNTEIPEIVITTFKKFNHVQPDEIHDGDTIFLSHDDNFVSFGFSALDYTNPQKNRYKYKLENYDKDWINIDGGRHFAEYTKVSPGTYTFRVKGSNNSGIWNNKGITVKVIISPAWYSTLFFRIIVGLLIVMIIWVIIYFRVRRIRKKNSIERKMLQIEKQLFDIQQKALRLQMNPHFIFNSLNSIQSYIVENDIDNALNYLAKFSQLMRLILTNSRESIIPLTNELQAVVYFMEIEQLRFENKFEYSIKIDPEIDEEFMAVPPMILQPFIENAIIHGLLNKSSKGKISIEFRKNGSKILCTITDNGVGRKQAAEIKKQSGLNSKSKGMMITKERLDIFNENNNENFSVKITDLKNKDGTPSGTKVDLTFLYREI